MKTHIGIKWGFSLLLLTATTPAWPQGAILFANRVTTAVPAIVAPISYGAICLMPGGALINGTNAIPYLGHLFGGIYARAGLYGGRVGTPEDQLTLLAPPSRFRTGSLSGFWTNRTLILSNYPVGSTILVQVRVWDAGEEANSYEEASTPLALLGKSAILTETLGDTNSPSALVGLTSFQFGPLITIQPVLYLKPTSTNTLVLSWESTNCPCELKVQTNPVTVGINTNWTVVTEASNPMVVPMPSTNVSVFYKIGQRPHFP